MGAVCAGITGAVVAAVGIWIFRDEWVDDDKRWALFALGLVFGGGTVLHALGVW